MPLPLAPLVPLVLRAGMVAGSVWALRRAVVRNTQVGRTDQRAEDALDDLDEGIAVHSPKDSEGQQNLALRVTRQITFRGRTYVFDAGAMARLRFWEIK